LDLLDCILQNNEAFRVTDLAINGHDLMAQGIPQGPRIAQALNAALDAVINEEIPNEKQALLSFTHTFAAPHCALTDNTLA
jgi:tRNA nucleotidyltransferase (CCA-adding enzyme)